MKNSTTILFLLFTIIFNSCDSDDRLYENLKELPIEQNLPVYSFDFDEKDFTGEIMSHFDEPYIINSENNFPEILGTLNLEIHDDLKNINYDKYSLILLFSFHVEQDPGISHKFYKNTEYDNNSEYEYLYSQSYKSFNFTENRRIFYYTGIVINKIPDNSKIQYRGDSY
jgi:hypothetical protein